MKNHIKYLTLIGVSLIIQSCAENDVKTHDKLNLTKEKRYSTKPFRTTYPKEEFIKSLDTSEWILKSYWIHPSDKSVIKMYTDDSLFYHRIQNDTNDVYSFTPSKGMIFKNGKSIGTIKTRKIDFDTLADQSMNKIGIRYHTLFYLNQPNDTIMNGMFNISYSRNERLQISQIRTENKTKKEEIVRLIFYKR
jgi:hypothetical protein